MIHADGHGAAEDGHDLLRMRPCGKVPIARRPTQQYVANRSPDDPGLEPGLLESVPDPEDLIGRGYLEGHFLRGLLKTWGEPR